MAKPDGGYHDEQQDICLEPRLEGSGFADSCVHEETEYRVYTVQRSGFPLVCQHNSARNGSHLAFDGTKR